MMPIAGRVKRLKWNTNATEMAKESKADTTTRKTQILLYLVQRARVEKPERKQHRDMQ